MAAEPIPIATDDRPPEKRWPGVTWAYDFVQPSYEITERRHDAVAARARSFLTIASAVVVAIPALAKVFADQVDLQSPWLPCGLFLFVVVCILGMWVQGSSSLMTIDPNALYDQTLHLDEWNFKWTALEGAADAFAHNLKRVNFEAIVVDAVGIFTLGQVLTLSLWLLNIPTP